MNDGDIAYFILGVVAWQIAKLLLVAINQIVIERRQRKFLRLVDITFKGQRDRVTFISVDSSDRRAMKRIEEQYREAYDLPESDKPHPITPDPGHRQH